VRRTDTDPVLVRRLAKEWRERLLAVAASLPSAVILPRSVAEARYLVATMLRQTRSDLEALEDLLFREFRFQAREGLSAASRFLGTDEEEPAPEDFNEDCDVQRFALLIGLHRFRLRHLHDAYKLCAQMEREEDSLVALAVLILERMRALTLQMLPVLRYGVLHTWGSPDLATADLAGWVFTQSRLCARARAALATTNENPREAFLAELPAATRLAIEDARQGEIFGGVVARAQHYLEMDAPRAGEVPVEPDLVGGDEPGFAAAEASVLARAARRGMTSERQRVLDLLAEGATYDEIARALSIPRGSVGKLVASALAQARANLGLPG
jgi:DNA-binding CsgD family transcriptional regulator